MALLDPIVQFHGEMTDWRRDIHAHPELGFEETRTSDFVASMLKSFGCEVTRGVGRTGLVGTLQAGSRSRAIGLRADMDALPIQERHEFAHRSQRDGVMHACGHDGHTTMLLGAARYLAQSRNFDGVVHFIFQPAEEGIGGANAMLADGLFDRFPCEAIFGMHNRPSLEVGRFSVKDGPRMAGGAFFDVTIEGHGGHGARPESSVDSIVVVANLATAIQTIVARNVPPQETAVVSVTQIHSGDAYNVIPRTARLGGTVRAFSRDVMSLTEGALKRIAKGVAETYGARAEVDFRVIFAPLVNDPEESEFAAEICAQVVAEDHIERNPLPTMASEDFSFMLERVPGCYLNIGTGGPHETIDGECEVHNPNYDFNDRALPYGASFFARLVETRLVAK